MGVENIAGTDALGSSTTQDSRDEYVYVFPVSFAQQRLLFLHQLDPDSTSYNVPWSIRITGPLNVGALELSLSEIVRRHEVLRTTFDVVEGRPVQIVSPFQGIPLVRADLRASGDPERRAQQAATEEARKPLNLKTGPLVRTTLLQLGDTDFVLLITTHHIAFDGWSRRILVGELGTLYHSYCNGRPSPLPELPLQYVDYAVWQRNYLQNDGMESLLKYWKEQLSGAPTTLDMPTDRPRPAVQSFRGASKSFLFPRSLSDSVNNATRKFGTTPFMTLLAAYYILLARYSGQDDIVLGAVIANRNRAELEGLIGLFANTIPLRARLDGDPPFRELLSRVKETALGAYAHQEMPFERLVEELRPERSLSYNPLFQVLFSLQSASRREFELDGLHLQPLGGVVGTTAKFDLSFFMLESGDDLTAKVEYNTDLFDAETIDRMVRHYLSLLQAALENPDTRISQVPLLTEAERHQVVVEWNATDRDYPRERSLHQFFEDQVERTPDALALVFESQQLTYQELNARANQLAHHLRKLGVGPEKLVAVCAERSIEMVVALLGVLKAGGAYVPIDPEYPPARQSAMLEDSEPLVLLAQERLLDVVPPHNIPTFCLDRDWHMIAGDRTDNPEIITNGKDQAYLIYTSGSTGKPKGVANVHEGIVNRLLWMQDAYSLDASDRVLQKTPYSFDVSVWEFFWPLMTGACLVVARPEGHRDPTYLVDLVNEQQITTMHFVPSMLRIFLETDGVERCNSLRRVICSGEALTVELQQRFFERLGAELHNLYGPTEAAVDVSYWHCKSDSELGTVPIGKPIWNTQLYILDKHLQPVPVGVPGELHIGGVGLARGYLKQPDLTSQKFIPDPFASQPGARLYKTGDLTRFLPDGNIEYLGRLDHQVKLRGFRIELDEIEVVLVGHPGVEQAVVVVREDRPGDKRLVAYVVGKPGQEVIPAELRSHLDDRLPGYMVPSAIVKLDRMPLTESGKINRRVLPAPNWSQIGTGNKLAPTDQMELILTRIWERVLCVNNISVEDNFFDLGGHSLMAVKLLSEVEKVVGRKIPLASLFRGATIAFQAKLLREEAEGDPDPLVMEYQVGQQGASPFFAVAAPGVRSLGYALLGRNLGDTQPLYKLQAIEPVVQGRPLNPTELRSLAQQYVAGMRVVQPEGPYYIVAMCGGCQIAEQMILQLESQGQTVALFAIFDTWVLEHAHRRWGWRMFGVQQRLRWLGRVSFSEKVDWIRRAVHNRIQILGGRSKPTQPWAEAYWPQDFKTPRFHAPVILFKRPKQPYYYVDDPFLGWGARSEGGVTTYEINASHHEVLREPHVQLVSRVLLAYLRKSEGREDSSERAESELQVAST